ncbi:MAG: glycosyltransferase family 117 protein [Dehalococcoidia bacterium]
MPARTQRRRQGREPGSGAAAARRLQGQARQPLPVAEPISASWSRTLAAVVFLLSLALYLATLAPTVTWRFSDFDSGELASAAFSWGVPHPTGYPLWTLLGFLITRLPFGDPAGRTNVLSALCGAGAVSLVSLTVLRLSSTVAPTLSSRTRLIVAAGTGLAFATSPAFWSQSILTETYSLHCLLIASIAWLLADRGSLSPAPFPARGGGAPKAAVREPRTTQSSDRGPRSSGGWLAFTCGLALTNHSTAIFAVSAAAFVVLLRLREKREQRALEPKLLLRNMVLFLLPLTLYLLIPWRAAQHPAENWNDPETLGRFLQLISGSQYHYLVDWRDLAGILGSMPAIVRLLLGQFAWWGLPLATYGLLQLWEADRAYAAFCLIVLAAFAAFTAVYRADGVARYLLSAYLMEALLIGCGLAAFAVDVGQWQARQRRNVSSEAILGGLVLLSIIPFAAYHFPSHNLRREHTAYNYARDALSSTPSNGTIVTSTDEQTFSLWYLQKVKGYRRDVHVRDSRLEP